MKIDIQNLNIWKAPAEEDLRNCEQRLLYLPEEALGKLSEAPPVYLMAQAIRKAQAERNMPAEYRIPGRKVLWYRLFLTKKLEETHVSELDLEQRSLNCLRRAGVQTVGDLFRLTESTEDLRQIRGCGESCLGDVMAKIFCCAVESLGEKDRLRFLRASMEIGREEAAEPAISLRGAGIRTGDESPFRIMSVFTGYLRKKAAEGEDGSFLSGILSELSERDGKRNDSGKLFFPVYGDTLKKETAVEELGLSKRACNSLRRAGLPTVRDLCEKFDGNEDILPLRNCGSLCTAEIFTGLLFYQYRLLDEKGKRDCLAEIRRQNGL